VAPSPALASRGVLYVFVVKCGGGFFVWSFVVVFWSWCVLCVCGDVLVVCLCVACFSSSSFFRSPQPTDPLIGLCTILLLPIMRLNGKTGRPEGNHVLRNIDCKIQRRGGAMKVLNATKSID